MTSTSMRTGARPGQHVHWPTRLGTATSYLLALRRILGLLSPAVALTCCCSLAEGHFFACGTVAVVWQSGLAPAFSLPGACKTACWCTFGSLQSFLLSAHGRQIESDSARCLRHLECDVLRTCGGRVAQLCNACNCLVQPEALRCIPWPPARCRLHHLVA